MAVSVFATKLEMVSAETAVVSIAVESDLGKMNFDVAVDVRDGDAKLALRDAGDKLRNFGNELLNAIGARSLRLCLPPK